MKKQSEWLPIYIKRELHAKLKGKASLEGKKLREFCEARLRPLVKNNGKAKR